MKEMNLISVRCKNCGYEFVGRSRGEPDPTKLQCPKCKEQNTKPIGPWVKEIRQ